MTSDNKYHKWQIVHYITGRKVRKQTKSQPRKLCVCIEWVWHVQLNIRIITKSYWALNASAYSKSFMCLIFLYPHKILCYYLVAQITPALKMGKLRHREIKKPDQLDRWWGASVYKLMTHSLNHDSIKDKGKHWMTKCVAPGTNLFKNTWLDSPDRVQGETPLESF